MKRKILFITAYVGLLTALVLLLFHASALKFEFPFQVPGDSRVYTDYKDFTVPYSDKLDHQLVMQSISFGIYDHARIHTELQKQKLFGYSHEEKDILYMYNLQTPYITKAYNKNNGKYRYELATTVKDGYYGSFDGMVRMFGT